MENETVEATKTSSVADIAKEAALKGAVSAIAVIAVTRITNFLVDKAVEKVSARRNKIEPVSTDK